MERDDTLPVLTRRDLIRSVSYSVVDELIDIHTIPGLALEMAKRFTAMGMVHYDPSKRVELTGYLGSIVRAASQHMGLDSAMSEAGIMAGVVRNEQRERIRLAITVLPPEEQDILAASQRDDFSLVSYAHENGLSVADAVALKQEAACMLRMLIL